MRPWRRPWPSAFARPARPCGCSALVWGSAPVVLYGLVQALGVDPVPWQTDAASRVLSTVGRANFLGSYLVLVFPLTVVAAWLASRKWPYWLLLAGQLAVLGAAAARSAWAGAAVAGVALVLFCAVALRRRRLAWAGAGLAGMLLLTVLLTGLGAVLPGVGRLASPAGTGSGAARLTIWRAVLPLIAARPAARLRTRRRRKPPSSRSTPRSSFTTRVATPSSTGLTTSGSTRLSAPGCSASLH